MTAPSPFVPAPTAHPSGLADSNGAGSPDPHRELQRRVRPLLGRPDPHRHQERRPRFPRDLYEYFRNSASSTPTPGARNRTGDQISSSPQAFRYNQFGYNSTGRVLYSRQVKRDRNKLFFLWGQEWVHGGRREPRPRPFPRWRCGRATFSELLNPSNRSSAASPINDPSPGAPFAGNIIPAEPAQPQRRRFLHAYPEPVPGLPSGHAIELHRGGRCPRTSARIRSRSTSIRPTSTSSASATVNSSTTKPALPRYTDRAPQIIDRPNETYSLNYICDHLRHD